MESCEKSGLVSSTINSVQGLWESNVLHVAPLLGKLNHAVPSLRVTGKPSKGDIVAALWGYFGFHMAGHLSSPHPVFRSPL
jgi:hypothetical protein